MLSILIFILITIFLSLVASFIPIGNEKSTVRRLPWITFAIMAVNVVIFYVTFPMVAEQQGELVKLGTKIEQFVKQHEQLLADPKLRKDLSEIGIISRFESDAITEQLRKKPELEVEYREWLRTG